MTKLFWHIIIAYSLAFLSPPPPPSAHLLFGVKIISSFLEGEKKGKKYVVQMCCKTFFISLYTQR